MSNVLTQLDIEALADPTPPGVVTQLDAEVLVDGSPTLVVTQLHLEVLQPFTAGAASARIGSY